jgi:hypothetical protein
MKFLIIILISFIVCFLSSYLIFFSGCTDNNVTGTNSSSNTINGKIENWHYGTNKYAVAYAENPSTLHKNVSLDSCLIDNIGNFSLNIKTPPDSVFSNLSVMDTNYCSGEILTDPVESKYSILFFRIHEGGNLLGIIYMCSDSLSAHSGQVNVWNVYVDRGGNISGNDSCTFPGGFVRVSSFNISFSQGLNYWYVLYNEYEVNKVNETMSSTQSQAVKWYATMVNL